MTFYLFILFLNRRLLLFLSRGVIYKYFLAVRIRQGFIIFFLAAALSPKFYFTKQKNQGHQDGLK